VAVFAGVLALSFYTSRLAGTPNTGSVPTEFRDLLSGEYRSLLDGLVVLEANPGDVDALKQVANAYSTIQSQGGGIAFAQKGIDYFNKYLQLVPNDHDARTDMAVLYFVSGSTDRAIQEVTTVITSDSEHIEANYNLGIFYWQGRRAYEDAARQITTAIDLADASSDPHSALIAQDARTALLQLVQDASQAGVELDVDAKYLPAETTEGAI
jgi:tetratricopeptide (TPR) repeat protein